MGKDLINVDLNGDGSNILFEEFAIALTKLGDQWRMLNRWQSLGLEIVLNGTAFFDFDGEHELMKQ